MEKKIKLRVQGLTNSQIHSSAYALVLAEENGNRRIPVIVGTAEAQMFENEEAVLEMNGF